MGWESRQLNVVRDEHIEILQKKLYTFYMVS